MSHQGQSLQQSSRSCSSEKGTNAIWGVWTPALVEKLIKLFEEGMSATYIAPLLGPGFTRNAILGKLHRLGVKRGKTLERMSGAVNPLRTRPKLRVISEVSWAKQGARKLALRERGSLKIRAINIEPRNIPLADLGKGDCRYPYGDGPFLFCGHPKLEGSSFCGPHHALCWMSPKERGR